MARVDRHGGQVCGRTAAAFLLAAATVLAGCSSDAGATASLSPSLTPAGPSPTAADPAPSSTGGGAATPASTAIGSGEAWIVYQSGGRIAFVRPDGSGGHPLLESAGETGPQLHPDWSHDGARVAFAADADDGSRDIWVANVDGTGLERIFDCTGTCGFSDDPAWSPDDTRIAFMKGTAVGDAGLGVGTVEAIELATGSVETLATGAATEYFFAPRWSPDGTKLVVQVDRFDSSRLDASVVVERTIAIVDLADAKRTLRPLLDWGPGAAAYPDWSPIGDRIVFERGTSDVRSEIFIIGADASDLVQLTDLGSTGGRGIQPTWVPSGDRIIFVGERVVGTPTVAFIRPDGSDLVIGLAGTHPRLRPVP